jgi:hypothetical protein
MVSPILLPSCAILSSEDDATAGGPRPASPTPQLLPRAGGDESLQHLGLRGFGQVMVEPGLA